jgi:hypothetical protein
MQESKINRQHNEYYLFGDRPVKFVAIDGDPARQILKYDWESGFFVPGSDYLQKILFGKDDVEELAEGPFIVATETLRRKNFKGDNTVFTMYALVESILEKVQSKNRSLSDEEEAMIFLIYKKTYDLFEQVSIMSENYWKK